MKTVIQEFAVGTWYILQMAHLSSGQLVKYKKLCICSGGTPKLIAENHPHVLGIRDTESVQLFQNRLKDASRIILVGNGGIATELVYELEGIQVIWVLKDKSMTATFVDPGAGQFFLHQVNAPKKKETISKRQQFNLSGFQTLTPLSALLSPRKESKETWPLYVELTNGKIYGCDFLVSATGVIPSFPKVLSKVTELKVSPEDVGIMVDKEMRTSVADVFAAGDVCTPAWQRSPLWFQMRLWTQARQMGHHAANCMVASFKNEQGHTWSDFAFEVFAHMTQFFGFKVVLLGLFNGQGLGTDYEVLLRVTKGEEYVKAILKDGKLKGAILIGDTNLEETFENLLLNQMDLSPFKDDLLNPNIDIEDFFD
ncbi:unnamed protein product [Darwinula stevensoni]|uniref:Pyridine nucleotide-disulfide oxidoreductase domain-containing protein 1 n=1 Tax=Darwinula stevensoni TaxID=69355 RepID=A0A7R8XH70_9CRUS|nr:unnamed protein product [Darwinula stevensoni]CAG0890154.1 unnamed protein product [Darwinula stevensoni]